MIIEQTTCFKRTVKKLHDNQKKILLEKIKQLIKSPEIGEMKKGDLAGVRVYKFQVINQSMLLSYIYQNKKMTLLSLGPHENFYKKLKK